MIEKVSLSLPLNRLNQENPVKKADTSAFINTIDTVEISNPPLMDNPKENFSMHGRRTLEWLMLKTP